MIFDKEQIAIQAGKPVEFRFSNSDFMPHNFVIVQQGALQEIGEMAEATALAADAKTRHYVPTSPKVMLASRLLESNQSQSLLFEAPKEPGIYPYVCTYPGHWRRMYGALYVVADLEQYNADPAGYLAANPMEFKDELLKFISRNTEWKYDDLIGKVATLPEGRSFEVGRNLFKVANCVACHQFGGEGYALGPDLTKMEPDKQTVQHILRSIVEPSQAIDDKYRSYAFLLDSGKLVTGTVVEENDDVVKILTDPLNVREPTVLSKDEIEERSKSQVSIMPAGLLNKLTEEEIVDLVAYIVAKGDKKNPIFGHDHDH
jgi:putative heme-binding domain-containing protein